MKSYGTSIALHLFQKQSRHHMAPLGEKTDDCSIDPPDHSSHDRTSLEHTLCCRATHQQPRVPDNKLEEARALKSPLPESSDVAAKGKEIYEGKGTVFQLPRDDRSW